MAHKTGKRRATRKSDLPEKTCPVCQRPFQWRRKWAAVWDEVRYCSEKCRREKGRNGKIIENQ